MQKAVRPLAGLCSSKARPDACMHLGELLCGLLHQRFFGCGVLFRSLFCVHLLHLSEAVYHVLSLTVTVVLGITLWGVKNDTRAWTGLVMPFGK